jgi:hypothetical protein
MTTTHAHLKPLKGSQPSADTWCFCKNPNCDGWDLYRTNRLYHFGVEPTDEHIARDQPIAEAYTAWAAEARSNGDTEVRFADFLDRIDQTPARRPS